MPSTVTPAAPRLLRLSRKSQALVGQPGVITAAAAAGLAAGCGGSGPASQTAKPLSPRQAIALAAEHARAVNSFGSTLSVRMAGPLSGIMAGTMQIRRRPSLLAGADFRTLDFGGRNLPGGMQEI